MGIRKSHIHSFQRCELNVIHVTSVVILLVRTVSNADITAKVDGKYRLAILK